MKKLCLVILASYVALLSGLMARPLPIPLPKPWPAQTGVNHPDLDEYRELYRQQSEQRAALGENKQRIHELERRVGDYDGKNLSERLSRMEEVSNTNHDLLVGMGVGIALLIAETFVRILRTRKGTP